MFTSLAAGLITALSIVAFGRQPLMNWGGLFTLDAKTHIDNLILAHLDYALWFLIQGTVIFGLPIMLDHSYAIRRWRYYFRAQSRGV